MEFAFLSRPKDGETVCGDGAGVYESESGTLLAVADGLGHGPEAHKATRMALEFIEKNRDLDLEPLLWGCHEHTRGTRGLALFLCRIVQRDSICGLHCAGIGNVECATHGMGSFSPFPRDGIVGRNVRKITVFEGDCGPGSLMAIYSDGIHARLDLEESRDGTVQEACQRVLRNHGKSYDDATVMIVRL